MRGVGGCACEAPWVRDASRRRTVFFFETTWIVKRCSDSLPPDATDASDRESRWPSGEPSASLDTRKKSPHAEVPTFATGLNTSRSQISKDIVPFSLAIYALGGTLMFFPPRLNLQGSRREEFVHFSSVPHHKLHTQESHGRLIRPSNAF